MKKQNIKTPIVFHIGVALLFALVISCCMMGGISARYFTKVTGSATSKVASFNVICTSVDAGSSKTLEIGSEETVTYTFTVENVSDVAINYTIEVANLPAGVTVTGNSSTFTLGIGESRNHTLTFSANDSATEVVEQNISVKVNAVQAN